MNFKKIIPLLFVFSVTVNAQSSTENYIKTTEYLTEDGESGDKKITVMYFDGLGREKQLKQIGASPNGTGTPGDLVTHFDYDGFGRQVEDFLPIPVSSSNPEITGDSELNGNYYLTKYGDQTWFSKKEIENSPLNRVMKQAAPGDDWMLGSGNEIEFEYGTNNTGEVKHFKVNSTNNYTGFLQDGNYAAGMLYKTTTTDENGNKIYEFKDKQGRVVLKRTWVADSSTAGKNTDPDPGIEPMVKADTYYVYDIYGNLAFVIPPLASAKSDPNTVKYDLCYQYKYDERNRLVEKVLPGKEIEYMVYDKQDRLVATQDANLRNNGGKWLFTKYDKFGRVLYTGITSGSLASIRSAANSATNYNNEIRNSSGFTQNGITVHYTKTAFPTSFTDVLTVNYYDNYDSFSLNGLTKPTQTLDGKPVRSGANNVDNSVKGMTTASFIRILGTDTWEYNYTFYDKKSRPTDIYKVNHLGGYTKNRSSLDFRGKPLETETLHKRNTSATEIKVQDFFTYDNMERPTSHYQSIDNSVRNLIADTEYNPLGQLETKYVGGILGKMIDRWQKIDYSYNIRGWLTRINDIGPVLMGKDAEPPTLGDDLFAFGIQYNELANGGSSITEPLYNGNIAQTFWKTAEDNILRGYHYTYDQMNRLRRADFYKQGNANITAYGEFIAYDVNGNIKNLVRSTGDATDNEIAMDDLAYTYQSGNGNSNRLMKVVENVTAGSGSGGFNNGTSGTNNDYTYDTNGNMTADLNKGITSITYNHLNLPTQIYWAADKKIDYIYNAAGQKVKKTVRDGSTIKTVDYLDGFQYAGGILQFFPTAEGYVKATQVNESPTNPDYAFNYVFNYTDHLGNVRLSFSKDPVTHQLKIMEENHYYPFGLKHSVYAGSLRGYKEDPAGPGTTVITTVTQTDYQYKFGAKEWQDELNLNLYDYHARNYDPTIGRTTTQDPLAEKFYSQSSYSFLNNNPVITIDPTGMSGKDFIDVDKFTGMVTVAEAPGDDKMRLIGEGGKVEKIETYGEHGSFERDNKIETNDIFASNGEYLRTEQIIESKNPDKLFNLFEFASNGNTVEYGFLKTQDGWQSNGYLYTSGLTGSLGDRFPVFFHNLMKSSLSLNVTELWHNHPIDGGGTHMRAFKPSGFDDDGNPNQDPGDRPFLETMKNTYINRVPQSANILLPNTNLMIRYNENNFNLFNRK